MGGPADADARLFPQWGQNAKSGGQGAPHAGQADGSLLPHLGQKAESGGAATPHPAHITATASTIERTAFPLD